MTAWWPPDGDDEYVRDGGARDEGVLGLDRVRHRRLSGPLSAMATRSGVSPNVVTLASLAVGLAAARRLAGEGAGCPFWPWSST